MDFNSGGVGTIESLITAFSIHLPIDMEIFSSKFGIFFPPNKLTFLAVVNKSIEISVPDGPTPITSTFLPENSSGRLF